MTYPCINPLHFQVVDGAITPQPYMQWRHVATNMAAGIDKDYDPNGGAGQAEDLYSVQVQWTNADPISMNVYAVITRGGSRVAASCRNRPVIQQWTGTALGVAPADPATATLTGQFGIGGDFGEDPISGLPGFAPLENRAGERSSLVGAVVVVPNGQTYKVRARIRFDSYNWETEAYYQGDTETELTISSGATRLDLYAYPVL
jgi:hypothetical protein